MRSDYGLLGGLGGRAPDNAANTPGGHSSVRARTRSWRRVLRLASGQLRQQVTSCSPKGGVRARRTCSTGRGRRLCTLSLQRLEVGLMAASSRIQQVLL